MKQSRSHCSSIEHLSPSGFFKFLSAMKFTCSFSLAVIFAFSSLVVNAQDEDSGDGFDVSIGTTVSHGIIYRMENMDAAYQGTPTSPNSSQYVNNDDGNKNYERGLVSSVSKVTSEISISKDDYGFFTRFTGFIDYKNQDGDRPYRDLSFEARKLVGAGVKLLDFYGYKNFEVGDVYGDVRVGNMVLNWGESTFVPNGINVINPFDVSRLRTPGAELKEALTPVPMVAVSVSPTDDFSVESFYQLKWNKTEIDPAGTYFSTVDYLGEGGNTAEIDLRPSIPFPPDDKDGWLEVTRRADNEPDDSGQFGIAFRYFVEQFGGTEIGAYFTRYHSRLPVISARSGTDTDLQLGLLGAGQVSRFAGATTQSIANAIASNPTALATAVGTEIANFDRYQTGLCTGFDPATRMPTPANCVPSLTNAEKSRLSQLMIGSAYSSVARGVADPAAIKPILDGAAGGFAAQLAIDRYIKSGYYFVDYPEDIDLFGLSFNTLLGNTGWALQGELSIHKDVPLQRDEAHLFAEGLKPVNDSLTFGAWAEAIKSITIPNPQYNPADPNNPYNPQTLTFDCGLQNPQAAPSCAQLRIGAARVAGLPDNPLTVSPTAQIGRLKLAGGSVPVVGFTRRDVSQLQLTGTKLFGPFLGADGGVFVIEVATTQVSDMPDKSVFPLEGPGADPATSSSWGYRAVTKLNFFNAISSINLHPYVQFAHDVDGTTPAPIANFVEGRKTLTLGVSADYLQKWGANLSFTQYSGAGLRNRLGDRDYLQLSVNYSF